MNILDELKKRRLFFDGAMGSLLQKKGLGGGEEPALWSLTHREDIVRIHKEYLLSGADILTTNTFGVNTLKFDKEKVKELVFASVSCAKEAIEKCGREAFVALDIGPTGKILKPLGDLDFEKCVDIFKTTASLAKEAGCDLIIIETMSDAYETKAALLAAKEAGGLPVFVTNAYGDDGRLMTGADAAAMTAMLEGLGADAIGINCSAGPDKMEDTVKDLVKYASVPVIVNPNAGLPSVKDGKTVYDIDADKFADYMAELAKLGACILGGCCGTTPEHIKKTVERTKDIEYRYPDFKNDTVVSSYTHAVFISGDTKIIGERINPTGKKLLKQAIKDGDTGYILRQALSQQEAGAHILDINVGLPEIDEAKVIKNVTYEVQSVTDLPLQIDTSDPSAMEAALRIYNGKPLINSVNGKKESMDKILPIAAKYGGVIIALTLDEDGIPDTAEGRFEIAERIRIEALKYGISKKDIVVDPLTLTVAAGKNNALVTIEAVKLLCDAGYKTSLGVSNVSFGLPSREALNSSFFTLAMQNGLSLAIINPNSAQMMSAYRSYTALSGYDEGFEKYIDFCSRTEISAAEKKSESVKNEESGEKSSLYYAVKKGLEGEAAKAADELLKNGTEPLEIINKYIIPALDEMGKGFESGKVYLPGLLMSAEASKAAFEKVKAAMKKTEEKKSGFTVVLATVKGDIHDIGKNIVKVLLENYGFDVIDLGKDVECEKVVEAAKESGAPLVGLSALMTTTVPAMEETIKLIRKEGLSCKVVVGGAVLTEEYAKMVGADKYSADAMETVRYAEKLKGIKEDV